MSFASTSSWKSARSCSPESLASRSTSCSKSSTPSSPRSSFSENASKTLANPYGSATRRSTSSSKTSSYVSDEDLFGDDDDPYLSEPPPPPRSAEVWLARPLLPPVREIKPRACITDSKKKRRNSSEKAKG